MSNSSIKRIDVKKRYSEIVIHNNTVYLSGQVPWLCENDNFTKQTEEVFRLIDEQLARAGSDKTKLLSLRIYIKDPNNYELMNSVFDNWIPDGCAPTRATIGNVIFPNPKWEIEVVVVASL
jgi:enamine deaminase RidA (YjgF/YER057c/UK114 family)